MRSTADVIFISQRVVENKEVLENSHFLVGFTVKQIHNTEV